MKTASIDSRQQTSAIRLRWPDEIPPDFPFPSSNETWEDAIFIPGDRRDWRGRMVHPPRLYTVTKSHLAVYTHPAFGVPPYRLDLKSLVGISCYKATLHGELQFHGIRDESSRLRYGHFQHHYIDPFLKTIRRLWLPVTSNESLSGVSLHGKLMDTRCHAAIHAELDEGERILQLCFLPFRPISINRWFLPRKRLVAARVLALTNRHLVLAVEGYAEQQEEYGVRIQSCIVSRLRKGLVRREHGYIAFQLVFESSLVWRLWVSDEELAISPLLQGLRVGTEAV